ncbi:MAG TPA: hypothetical protein DDY29_15925 [Rhodobacteraceae bacterium]|nr:MAG: hypothetical protein N838_12220 [Thiohalocapsa sp. PB-PSB1]HBH00138.1 hypothetical protein [Paracoccaceae bacterium]
MLIVLRASPGGMAETDTYAAAVFPQLVSVLMNYRILVFATISSTGFSREGQAAGFARSTGGLVRITVA